jgi:hypothetical protein
VAQKAANIHLQDPDWFNPICQQMQNGGYSALYNASKSRRRCARPSRARAIVIRSSRGRIGKRWRWRATLATRLRLTPHSKLDKTQPTDGDMPVV